MHSQRTNELEAINKRFGENLRRAREARGLTQEELAHLAGIHRTEVGLLERAGREPRLATLVKLATALGVPLGDLFEGIGWRSSEPMPAPGGRFRVAPKKTR
jgi:transcriptional regulator with XRE-family HTH domain